SHITLRPRFLFAADGTLQWCNGAFIAKRHQCQRGYGTHTLPAIMFNRVTERGDCSLACRFAVEITILAQRFQDRSGGKALHRMTMRICEPATYYLDNAILARKSQPGEGATLYNSVPGRALQQFFQ